MKRSCVLLTLAASSSLCFTGVVKPGVETGEAFWHAAVPVRLMERADLGFTVFETAWVLCPTVGDPAVAGPAENYTGYRIEDLAPRSYPEEWKGNESFSILQNLDRLSFQLRPGRLKLTAGRQAIFWGVSKSVSPTDFIAPFPYGTIDTEFRTGVDALRAVCSTGMLSEVETGCVFGESSHENGYWLRGRFYSFSTDVSVLGALLNGSAMAGGSLNRALGGSVGWVEAAYSRHDSGEDWWSMSAGVERSFFQSTLYGFLEYHYNSAGAGSTDDYISNTATEPYRNGTVYLLAKHYMAAGSAFSVTSLFNLSLGVLANADDLSARISLEADRSLSDNGSVRCSLSGGTGSPATEFGGIPLLFSTMYSLYF